MLSKIVLLCAVIGFLYAAEHPAGTFDLPKSNPSNDGKVAAPLPAVLSQTHGVPVPSAHPKQRRDSTFKVTQTPPQVHSKVEAPKPRAETVPKKSRRESVKSAVKDEQKPPQVHQRKPIALGSTTKKP